MQRRCETTPVANIEKTENGIVFEGNTYPSKTLALLAAAISGYRYASGAGTYWGEEIQAIPENIRARCRKILSTKHPEHRKEET